MWKLYAESGFAVPALRFFTQGPVPAGFLLWREVPESGFALVKFSVTLARPLGNQVIGSHA